MCDDSVERDRWIANVRAAERRPLARFCFSCANYAHIPPTTAYAATSVQRALAGDLANKQLYLVLTRGHIFVYASETQHSLDRSRVLRVLHLHG